MRIGWLFVLGALAVPARADGFRSAADAFRDGVAQVCDAEPGASWVARRTLADGVEVQVRAGSAPCLDRYVVVVGTRRRWYVVTAFELANASGHAGSLTYEDLVALRVTHDGDIVRGALRIRSRDVRDCAPPECGSHFPELSRSYALRRFRYQIP